MFTLTLTAGDWRGNHACQRRASAHAARREGHDWLVVQHELGAIEGVSQVPFERQAFNRALMHRHVEDDATAAAGRLRTVHGEIRITHQLFTGTQQRRADGDADARGGKDLLSLEAERRRQRLLDTFGDPHRITGIADIFQQNGELVATESRQGAVDGVAGVVGVVGVVNRAGCAGWSRDGVVTPQGLGHPAGDFEQILIAGRMAEAVVDRLEPIEVDEQHGERVLRAA